MNTMFKNNVFNVSVDTKKWLKKAVVRAVKTMAQTFVATVGTATVMGADGTFCFCFGWYSFHSNQCCRNTRS